VADARAALGERRVTLEVGSGAGRQLPGRRAAHFDAQ